MYEFYDRGMMRDSIFITTIRETSISLGVPNIGRIFWISTEGWDHYVCHDWLPLDNLPSTLEITRKFSGNPCPNST